MDALTEILQDVQALLIVLAAAFVLIGVIGQVQTRWVTLGVLSKGQKATLVAVGALFFLSAWIPAPEEGVPAASDAAEEREAEPARPPQETSALGEIRAALGIGSGVGSDSLVAHIRRIDGRSNRITEYESYTEFKLFLLSKDIEKYGAIALRRTDLKDTFGLIQAVLQGISRYDGDLDGDPEKTRRAVVAFQNWYNNQVPEDQRLRSVGYFGYGTLEAIRSHYRSRSRT